MKTLLYMIALTSISIFAIGCDQNSSSSIKSAGTADAHTEEDGHDDHDHASHDHKPPHGGHLIELGRNHEYHAELLEDHETESITIYIMDADMKELSIPASSISLVLTAASETKTFELTGIQPGGSSEFKSNDEALMTLLESEGVKGKLRVTIDGKPFTGEFDHEGHDHEGHDHDQEGDDHEENDH